MIYTANIDAIPIPSLMQRILQAFHWLKIFAIMNQSEIKALFN